MTCQCLTVISKRTTGERSPDDCGSRRTPGVKPAPFEYAAPATVDEAVAILAEHGDDAKVLAGGQSLVPLLALRLARPAVVVDINRVHGLDAVRRENGHLRVGALVRHAAFDRTRPDSDDAVPLL